MVRLKRVSCERENSIDTKINHVFILSDENNNYVTTFKLTQEFVADGEIDDTGRMIDLSAWHYSISDLTAKGYEMLSKTEFIDLIDDNPDRLEFETCLVELIG